MNKLCLMAAAALLMLPLSAQAQTPLTAYANKDGYLDVQKITCEQIANTFEEDAIIIGAWYSGWYNGLGKKHEMNLPRLRTDIHEAIVYCKAHKNEKLMDAIEAIIKREHAENK